MSGPLNLGPSQKGGAWTTGFVQKIRSPAGLGLTVTGAGLLKLDDSENPARNESVQQLGKRLLYKTVEELTVSDVEAVQMADYSLGMDQGVKLASGDHRWCAEVTLRDARLLRMRFYSKQNRDDWVKLLAPYARLHVELVSIDDVRSRLPLVFQSAYDDKTNTNRVPNFAHFLLKNNNIFVIHHHPQAPDHVILKSLLYKLSPSEERLKQPWQARQFVLSSTDKDKEYELTPEALAES